MRHEHLWKVYPGLGIAWPPCPVIVGCMFRNSITWHSRSADLTWGRETTCTNQHALLRISWQPESPTGPTGEVPRRHRHTTATPSEAPKNIAVQELLKDHEWSHDIIWIHMISHVGKEMKWFKLGESWWGLCQSDGVRAPSQTGRLRSFPRDTMICETFVCWQLVYVLHPVVCIGCIFSGVWTAAVGTRTTQVLLQTRQPLQVDWGRPFSERDGSIYSSPIPPCKMVLYLY